VTAEPLFSSIPDVRGASASINSAEWYICRLCGATVIDWDGYRSHRDRHEQWHADAE